MRQIKFQYIYELLGTICRPTLTLEQIEEGLASADSFPSSAKIIAKRQFTGLQDKNGVDIYKGDIVKTNDGSIGTVTMGCFGVDLEDGYDDGDFYTGQFPSTWSWSEFEVIGNIHENPELLKGSE